MFKLNVEDGVVTVPRSLTPKESAKAFGDKGAWRYMVDAHINGQWYTVAYLHPDTRQGGYYAERVARGAKLEKLGRKSVFKFSLNAARVRVRKPA